MARRLRKLSSRLRASARTARQRAAASVKSLFAPKQEEDLPAHALAHSPLGRLPAEIRLEIYKYVLIHDGGISVASPRGKMVVMDGPHQQLALTETCKLIRCESLPIFYGQPFSFLNALGHDTMRWDTDKKQLFDADVAVFEQWMEQIGEYSRVSIRELSFDLGRITEAVILHSGNGQRTWWAAAKRGAAQLRRAALSERCRIYVRLAVDYWCAPRLTCYAFSGTVGPRTVRLGTRIRILTTREIDAAMCVAAAFGAESASLAPHTRHNNCEVRLCEVSIFSHFLLVMDAMLWTRGMPPNERLIPVQRLS